MEKFSPVAETVSVAMAIPPYLTDHRFGNRAVLPAVETMQLLARTAQSRMQGGTGRRITGARFDKFLALPDPGGRIELLVDLDPPTGGRIRARLKTRLRAGKSAMTRIKTHGSLFLSPLAAESAAPPAPDIGRCTGENPFLVEPRRLYRELVPFGPAYRNIREPLSLGPEGAVARIRAPRLPADETPLGSPFALDAAFHAACVWGQRYRNVMAFPVALDQRSVWEPTRAGEEYTAVALPAAADEKRLVFDIWILGPNRRVRETVFGVEMRDVSGGRWKPPGWISEGRR